MLTYPIFIDGAPCGKLTVDQQGGRTVFDAECRMRPDLLRLSVYGGGREGYLGVLSPEDGALRLHRAFSRNALREFPAEIERVERAGQPPEEPAPPPDAEAGTETRDGSGTEPETEARNEPDAEAEAETDAAAQAQDDLAVTACAEDAENTENTEDTDATEDAPDLLWYSTTDGALVCFDGTRTLLALTPDDPRVPTGVPAARRSIEGRAYLVYATKNGRIVR